MIKSGSDALPIKPRRESLRISSKFQMRKKDLIEEELELSDEAMKEFIKRGAHQKKISERPTRQ